MDEATGRDERAKDAAIEEFHETGRRRRLLFAGVAVFLTINAVAFFVLLFWVFWIVAYEEGDWHLMGFVAMPGALLATIAIMAMRAVYNVSERQSMPQEISSMTQVLRTMGTGSWS